MTHTQHALADLAGIGNGLVIFAVGLSNNMELLQLLGIIVAFGGLGVGISREIRGWVRKEK